MQQVTIQQVQSSETTPLYRLPVTIDIYTSKGKESKRVTLTKPSETFRFPVSEKPLLVNFDSQKMLLCSKTDNHTSNEWISLYNKGPLYMDRYEAVSKIMKDYSAGTPEAGMMKKALDDPHWNIRAQVIKNCKTLVNADREGMKLKLMQLGASDRKSDVRMKHW